MSQETVEGRDYYVDESGLLVFTAHYLKRRGFCCENGCRHCPYGFRASGKENDQDTEADK